MVYVFDPTTCEEPKKPTYRYSPIPKTVKHCCCPKPAEEEAEKPAEVVEEKPIEAIDKPETTPVDKEPAEVVDKAEENNNNEAPIPDEGAIDIMGLPE